jgi:hypothetical protein
MLDISETNVAGNMLDISETNPTHSGFSTSILCESLFASGLLGASAHELKYSRTPAGQERGETPHDRVYDAEHRCRTCASATMQNLRFEFGIK